MSCKDTDGMMGMDMLKDDEVMMDMTPQGLSMMLSNLPKEKRAEVVLDLIPKLVGQAYSDMSEEEKRDFINKLVEKIKQ